MVSIFIELMRYKQFNSLYFRPIDGGGERVKPGVLAAYRDIYNFRAPCCLCAVANGGYSESAIYIALDGQYAGEYVAGCAKAECGYSSNQTLLFFRPFQCSDSFGTVCIGRIYRAPDLEVKRYLLRGKWTLEA